MSMVNRRVLIEFQYRKTQFAQKKFAGIEARRAALPEREAKECFATAWTQGSGGFRRVKKEGVRDRE